MISTARIMGLRVLTSQASSKRLREKKCQSFTSGEVSCYFILLRKDDYFGQLGVGNDRVTHAVPKVCSFNILIA